MDFSQLAFEFQWEQCFSLIDKWKTTMTDHIDNIHSTKLAQIQMYKDEAEKNFILEKSNLILNMNECFQHPCILPYEINTFKNKLKQLKQNIIDRPLPLNIHIETLSLENSITIDPIFNKQLFENKKIHTEFKIPLDSSIRLISTSNNQIILINNDSMIYFYDKLIGFIDKIDLKTYTNEDLNDICWSDLYKNFLFLCDYSLWSLENLFLKKLAHITNQKHLLKNLITFKNYLYLSYNHGEFVDRWKIQPEWKLDKRWIRYVNNNDCVKGIYSNNDYLLFYTKSSIQLCTEDLIIQYSIDLTNHEHIYTNFIYLSRYHIWLMIDKQKKILNYFHRDNRIIQTIDQIFVQGVSLMGSDDIAFVIKDENYHLQIISI